MKFLFTLVTQRWHKSFWVFDTERYWKAYNGGFFFACFLRNAEACILKILSSSNRGGGVAPDCMDSALKTSFPWLQSPLCCNQVFFSHPEWVATQFQGKLSKRLIRNRHPVGSRGCDAIRSEARHVHLFNSGLYSTWWSFYNQFRLSYFPLAFRLFPPWGINQNLSERKIKTRPYWIWSGFVLYSMHGY